MSNVTKPGAIDIVAETMIGTKVAEYLASGLPIIVNEKVGGIQSIMARHKIGLAFDSENLSGMLDSFTEIVNFYDRYQSDCWQVAARYFSVPQVALGYFDVYKELFAKCRLVDESVCDAREGGLVGPS